MLQEEASSKYFFSTASRYNTSVNPLLFAIICAFKTYSTREISSCYHAIMGKAQDFSEVAMYKGLTVVRNFLFLDSIFRCLNQDIHN